jgi:hypothetical protein
MIRQLAWLDFHRGEWHLITGNPRDPIRQWMDKEKALSDLAGEGWNINGPFPKKPDLSVKAWGPFQGYSLERIVH